MIHTYVTRGCSQGRAGGGEEEGEDVQGEEEAR